jgi:hypothetical protein
MTTIETNITNFSCSEFQHKLVCDEKLSINHDKQSCLNKAESFAKHQADTNNPREIEDFKSEVEYFSVVKVFG